jgi:hypothetical protein
VDRRRALGVVAVMAVVAVLGGCASAGAGSRAPDTTSPSPQATPTPTVAPTPAVPSPSATARPTPKPTTAPVPPKPTGATFHEDVDCLDADCNEARTTQTVAWRTPRTRGVTIRVYGVTECLALPAHPKPGASGPCLVTHTRLPASVLRLLAKAPASAGKVSWSWTQATGCDVSPFGSDPDGPGYFAVVVGAYSASGQSIFAIAEPGRWEEPLSGWMPC